MVSTGLPWPRPWEPPYGVRVLVQLVTLPPILLIGVPLSAAWNVLTYLAKRPPHTLRQHLVINVVRFFQTANSSLKFVVPADTEAAVIPKAALKRLSSPSPPAVSYDVRTAPPIPDSLRLECTKLTPGMEGVQLADVPLFSIVPKGTGQWDKAKDDEIAIFYIVGGGYQLGHPLRFPMTTAYVERTGLRLFSPNYRKAINDAGAYPAPLLDMLAGWQYVVDELGFEPKNIVVLGESAGGHATLMLTRYLDELIQSGHTRWGLPGAIFSSAPWGNMLCNFESIDANFSKDWLAPIRNVMAPAFLRHCAGHLTDPIISPALAPAGDAHWGRLQKNGTIVHVDCGTDEVVYDDGCAIVKSMRESGLEVDFREVPGGVHCEYAIGLMAPNAYKGAGFSWPLILGDLDNMIAKLRARP